MNRGHNCPLCSVPDVPSYRFSCHRCYRSMPDAIRGAMVTAWRNRVLHPTNYFETLAGVMQWRNERATGRH